MSSSFLLMSLVVVGFYFFIDVIGCGAASLLPTLHFIFFIDVIGCGAASLLPTLPFYLFY
jgi:hypothetical protein